MKIFLILLWSLPMVVLGQAEKKFHRPAIISLDELREYADLSPARKRVLKTAMETAKKTLKSVYQFGGSSPEQGGFDCSGAMYYVLKSEGLKVPRNSAQQFLWIRDAGKMIEVPAKVRSLDHETFKKLTPGDLVFWSGTYIPSDARTVKISHVGMYLGTEKKDGRPVMNNATKGRSYRGKAGDGFGVYDFRIPSAKSRSKLVGFGSPPGLK